MSIRLADTSYEEYAAMWGCDPNYDLPPCEPGDGTLFYNFGSHKLNRTPEFLSRFAAAIRRTIAWVEQRPQYDGHDDERPGDLEDLAKLLAYVEGLVPKSDGRHPEPDVTPQTHPDHHTVGKHFGGHSFRHSKTVIYRCEQHDPWGYWLVNVNDPTDVHSISERAIGRTFYLAEERADHWFVTQWYTKVPK